VVAGLVSLVLAGGWSLASATCGDTNNDQEVSIGDALRALRKSVGQDIELTCSNNPDLPSNKLGISNNLLCDGLGFFLTMTWTEHPEMVWTAYSDTVFPMDPADVQPVNDLILGGSLHLDFDECGSTTIDLTKVLIEYRLPNYSVSNLMFQYEGADDRVYLFVTVENHFRDDFETTESRRPSERVAIGSFASEGLSSASNRKLRGLC